MTELILATVAGFIVFTFFFLVFTLKRWKGDAPARFHSCGKQEQGCTCGKAQTNSTKSCDAHHRHSASPGTQIIGDDTKNNRKGTGHT